MLLVNRLHQEMFYVELLSSLTADFDKCTYSSYGIGFDERWSFSLSDGRGFSKNLKTTGNGYAYDFSVNYDRIDIDYILDIHEYLMNKHDIKQCLSLFKKIFIGLSSTFTAINFGESWGCN